jgi:hypothetical protein
MTVKIPCISGLRTMLQIQTIFMILQLLCSMIVLLTSPMKLSQISMVWTSLKCIILCIIHQERTFGGNTISKVESQYSGTNKMVFFCYSASFADKKKMQHVICYSIPLLLNLLLYAMVRIPLQHRLLCSVQE